MATWKKIITSGSNADLNTISASQGAKLPTITDVTTFTAGGDLDIGAHDFRASTLTADGLTSGRVTFAGTNGVLSDSNNMTFATDTLTVSKIAAFSLTGKLTAGSTEIEGSAFDIDGGTIDGAVMNNTTIGSSTATTAKFTSISSSLGLTLTGGNVSGSSTSTGSFGNLMVGGTNYTNTQLDSAIAANAVTALNNATANELVTVGSTTTELDAESALTFTGTTLSIVGNGAKVEFFDSGDEHISANNAGVLSINAGTEVDITATTVDINGAVDISGNTVIGGDLTVNGTTTTIESVNLAVSESLILLASGSSGANVDAGLLAQSGSVAGSGSALYHDTDSERWSVAKGIAQDATGIAPDQFVTTVKVSTASPSGTEYGIGEMWIDTNEDDGAGDGTIYILTAE